MKGKDIPDKYDAEKLSKSQLLKKYRVRFMGSILKSPGKRVPSIRNFEIKTREFNTLLADIGIKHKLPSVLKFTPNGNFCNRYIGHQILRLRKAKQARNSKLFGRIAWFCLRSSKSFRLSGINHVIPNGGFGISFSRVHQINRGINGIFRDFPRDIDFKRVYIPKKNQKGRPLGVPTIEGRIALHMLNNMIVLGFEGQMLDSQHAYLPGRGCNTAGMAVIDKVIDAKYIYETDIRGFFDNVSVFEVYDHLRRSNMSQSFISGLYSLCKSVPKLPKEQKMSEEKYDKIDAKTKVSLPRDIVEYMVETGTGKKIFSSNLSAETLNHLIYFLSRKGVSYDEYLGHKNKMDSIPGGVPQGSPISPFLAILALRPYLSQQTCVNYADDQIFYGEKLFTIKDDPKNGITHAEEKCGGIKKDGIGLKELKFLGLIYNPGENTLRSETRKERKERIKDSLIELGEEMEGSDTEKTENYLKKMAEKNFFGFILSSLYCGTGETRDFPVKPRQVNKYSLYQKYVQSSTVSSGVLQVLGNNIRMKTVRKLISKEKK